MKCVLGGSRCAGVVAFVGGLSFFFFKHKTAYEMRISDWSSDVCSSDLRMATTANLDAHSLHDVVDARRCVHLKSPMGIRINRSVDVSGLCHTRPDRKSVV